MTACRRVAIGKDDVLLREDIVRMDTVEIEHRRLHAVVPYLRER
jgi:hypothetical protein